jgi:hypothetical protein
MITIFKIFFYCQPFPSVHCTLPSSDRKPLLALLVPDEKHFQFFTLKKSLLIVKPCSVIRVRRVTGPHKVHKICGAAVCVFDTLIEHCDISSFVIDYCFA